MKNPFRKTIKKDDLKLVGLLHQFEIETVLDVGANVGQYASSLRHAGYKGRIISFEPLSKNIAILKQKSAKDKDWIIHDRIAIGDAKGEVSINISEHSDMSSILDIEPEMVAALPKSQYVETENVMVETIDHVIKSLDIQGHIFLKVDTQGFEDAVVRGAAQSLRSGALKGVQLELSLLPLYKGEKTYDVICSDVITMGFETYQIITGFFSKAIGRQLQADFVFFKSE